MEDKTSYLSRIHQRNFTRSPLPVTIPFLIPSYLTIKASIREPTNKNGGWEGILYFI